MYVTDQARERPHRCAVLPYIGNSNCSGWIDTGGYLDREKVYVSFEAAAEMARLIGWVAPSQRRGLEQENTSLQARVEQLEAELEDERAVNSSIEFLGTKDFVARQKRGPKRPSKPAAKAAER
jgi:hypothetical protein